MKKKAALVLALLMTVTTALTGCGSSIDYTADAVNVDGMYISLGEVNFYLRYEQAEMQSVYGYYFGDDFLNTDLTGSGEVYGVTIRDEIIDLLAEYYLVEAHAEELGVSLSEEDQAAVEEATAAFLAANDSKTLKAMSADEETVSHVLSLIVLQVRVEEELASRIDTEVSEEESNQKRVSYVMISVVGTTDDDGNTVEYTEEELEEIREELLAIREAAMESGDFDAAAEEYDLTVVNTTFGSRDTVLNDDMKNAADLLEEGEFSDVVESESAYYLVYMESLYDEEATEAEIEEILEEREQEAYDDWIGALQDAASITVNESVLAQLTFERTFSVKSEDTEE